MSLFRMNRLFRSTIRLTRRTALLTHTPLRRPQHPSPLQRASRQRVRPAYLRAGRQAVHPLACPHGAPITGLDHAVNVGESTGDTAFVGYSQVERLLIGGCMAPSDASYAATAEVHVPAMCTTPVDIPHKGCMFPRAWNYDMTATQSDTCYFNVQGCTDSTALNYNIEANTDDGSCLDAVKGCTMNTWYAGVNAGTPGYDTAYVGTPLRSVGIYSGATTATMRQGQLFPSNVDNTAGGAGLTPSGSNYNANANVNEGCILYVEGCMDSLALNYDSFANANTNTWCVPITTGCMMPTSSGASFNYLNSAFRPISTIPERTGIAGTEATAYQYNTGTSVYKNGLAVNYDAAATVDTGKTGCTIERYGCMDPTAVNYDRLATASDVCWPNTYGCLHPGAVNYGCPGLFDFSKPAPFPRFTTPCYTGSGDIHQATTHVQVLCSFALPPPAPPVAACDGGCRFEVSVSFLSAEDVSYFTTTVLRLICDKIGSQMVANDASMTTLPDCTADAQAGSTQITTTTTVASAAQQTAGVSTIQSAMASPAMATSLLGLSVLNVPTVEAVTVYDTNEEDNGAVIGGAIGGSVGGLLLIGLVVFMVKRKKSKVEA